ncbi:uncharacterized protein LOC143207255 isoform X2 [Lasioglossum baleicum]|uniref:uncharacterized protein LOC143207255 isoform X2 n=1 Tax=Lasioglossum baleicum TaxID=434251 RepID=UPI003FCEDF9B
MAENVTFNNNRYGFVIIPIHTDASRRESPQWSSLPTKCRRWPSVSLDGAKIYPRGQLSNSISPDILEKCCEQSAQPFLKWFNENVNRMNVLSNEEVQLKNKLRETNEWMDGLELDSKLKEATRDCPDLSRIVSFDDVDISDLFAEFEIVKSSYNENENYILTSQNGIESLKKRMAELDDEIEKESELLNKEYIAESKAYSDCSMILDDFDMNNHEFFTQVECLLNQYADAAENKGTPSVWTQMPLELFSKNIKLYYHYLGIHIKKRFGNGFQEQKKDSNYASLINESQEVHVDNAKLQELTMCKANLINVKVEEVLAKVKLESYAAMLEYAQKMYNNGNLKVPKPSELRSEISKLTTKRDFLEESVSLLEHQLSEIVPQFAELEMTQILKQDACSKIEQRKIKLDKVKSLQFLIKECGHVNADLLFILMQIQLSRLIDISEFVADTYHYMTSEYSLSSTRCGSMQQQQKEYSTLVSSSPDTSNSFVKLLVSILCDGDNTQQLNSALDKYNELLNENKVKKQFILRRDINSKIDQLEILENEINLEYISEIQTGPTYRFKPISYEIETYYKEAFDHLQNIQADLTKIRSQMKERMTDLGFERDRHLVWQRFLVDPDMLKQKHKEGVQITNKTCFRSTSEPE